MMSSLGSVSTPATPDTSPWSTDVGVVYVRRMRAIAGRLRVAALATAVLAALLSAFLILQWVNALADVSTAKDNDVAAAAGVESAQSTLSSANMAFAAYKQQLVAAAILNQDPVGAYFGKADAERAAAISPQAQDVQTAQTGLDAASFDLAAADRTVQQTQDASASAETAAIWAVVIGALLVLSLVFLARSRAAVARRAAAYLEDPTGALGV